MDPELADRIRWRYHSNTCIVPSCPHNSSKDLLFIPLRPDLKEKWCKILGRNCPKRFLYCCHEEINPQEDLKNYMQHKLLKVEPQLKPKAMLRNLVPQELMENPAQNIPKTRKLELPSTSTFENLQKNTKDRFSEEEEVLTEFKQFPRCAECGLAADWDDKLFQCVECPGAVEWIT